MNYKTSGKEELIHGLFGGIKKKETHNKYLIRLSSLKGDYHCNFQVLDQDKICTDIPKIRRDTYLIELRKHGIYLTDMQNKSVDLMYEKSPLEIHVLLGADVAGKLLTGKVRQLKCGLSCVYTRLGLTMMGKTEKREFSDSTKTVLSLHVNDAKISDLWCLDSLGITDPATTHTRKEIDEIAKIYFRQSLKRDSEGRYQVSLPWLEGHEVLPDNRLLAEKRLKSCVKNLQSKNCLKEYENIFNEWAEEGIIESVEDKKTENCHYLPHRAVIKESSTTKIRPVFDASAKERNGVSLNDCLEKGPNYLELIPSILNRFRLGKYGVISDIHKAFLQIGVCPSR
ncbi:uncharacterized protein LOC118197394 [Stegodyphus dumicola]|uniref:uncharacterized protein LOC118197394 n=1 Tax=Stegodyphus dumicola TaxID=202533 RepID=UPI0015B37B99|nr:uncharacterized protein LOC118197394 [Stegodyphus dumicola]